MAKDLFKVVKEKYGPKLESLIHDKITVIAGDITRDYMGLNVSTLEELYEQVEIVINLAATTDFNARFDIAMGINTIGPANVLSFCRQCTKLRVLLHVSTAYVCGEEEGLVLETPFKFGETLNGTYNLDIYKEKECVEAKLEELRAQNASEKCIASAMKDLGFQRARKYGWPNTYSFTKAMGEMLLGRLKEETPIVIVRPTIITSTYKEPFPGWLEGIRHIDSFVMGYGKGKMTCFPGDPQSIVDLIPADMVVNAMLASMAAHSNEPGEIIYHVGSSMSNPIHYSCLQDYGFCFFTERPWLNNDGKPVVVTKMKELSTIHAVERYMQIHFFIPLKILSLVNTASCQYFQATHIDLSRRVKFLKRLVELFSPYVFFKGVFDDMNTEKLRMNAKESIDSTENEIFYFDPKCINWKDYFMYTHIAGVVKHAF